VTGEQADAAGNSGRSAPTTFRIDATAPAPTLTTPSNGSLANATPTFAGAAGIALGDSAAVTVRVYAGSSATGSPVLTLPVTAAADHTYSVDAPSALAGGTYTAITQQSDDAGNLGSSAPSTFTVTSADVTSPTVTMTAPANGSSSQGGFPAFGGAAGTAAGDLSTVTVRIYLGLSPTGTPVESISATASGATWSGTVDIALPEGTYVAQADQSDAAGNTGSSGAVIFTVGMAYRDVVVADGASAYWRFGESSGITATDALGGNSGTYSSGVTLNRVGGLLPDTNKSIALDGVTGAVTVADSPGLDFTTGATIEVWVKRAKSGAYQVVVGKAGDGQSKNESYALWISSNDHLAAYFGDRSSYVSVFSTGPLDGNWHYVVATYDNSVARLYVDGVLNNAQPSAVHLTPNNLPLNIGRDSSGTYMFQGQLDEVAVYPLALTAQQVATHYGRGDAFDSDPPKVTLATPMAGTTTSDTTPDFAGMAPVTATDSATVSVNLYAGTSPTGTPISTLTTTRYARGSWNAEVPTPLAQGTYTVQAQEVDNSGNVGTSNPVIFTVGPRPDPGTDPVVLAAGDISYCGGTGDDSTALLLDQFPTASVFTMGDNAYEHGTVDEFQNCYDPTWGRAKARTYPTPGDHDYSTANGAAYFNYFAAQLAPFAPTGNDPNRGWYSFDLGSWHIAMTNSNCGNSAPLCNNDAQLQWLQADLAAHPVQCTLVVTQDPRFSSGPVHGSVPEQKPVWDILIAAGADVVLTADDHDYERFGHQDTQGFASPTGPREFVVGTGGRSHYLFSDPNAVIQPNSEVRDDATWGVIKLNLRAGSYDWEFVPTLGATFTDSGSDTCH
jgi:hypothetical protein